MNELTITVGPERAEIVGADNRALQAAVDYVAAAGGGVVGIRPGTYRMDDSLHLRSHVRVIGEGERTILRKSPMVRTTLVGYLGYGHYDIWVKEPDKLHSGMGVVIFDKNAPGFYQTQATLTWRDGNRFGVSRMLNHDYDGDSGGTVLSLFPVVSGCGVEGASVENLAIDGNRAENEALNGCRGGGVFLIQAHHVALRGVTVRDFYGEGISFQQCLHTLIEDCTCEGNAGMGLHPGSGSVAPVIRRCTLRRNDAGGVFYCLRVTFSLLEGCTIDENAGIAISVGGRDTDHLIRNNTIRGNGQYGLYFRRENEVMAGHRCRFEHNTLERNCTGRYDAEIFLDATVQDVHLLRNRITVGPASGKGVGIRVGPEARRIVAFENEITGALTQPIEMLGPKEAVSIEEPKVPLAVGPDAAPEDAARHLFA